VQFRLTSYQDMGTVYRARPRGGTHCRTIVEAKCHHDGDIYYNSRKGLHQMGTYSAPTRAFFHRLFSD